MPCPPNSTSLGNILVVSSTTRPVGADLYVGRRIYELDTSRELTYDGTGWIIMSEPMVTTFVPVVASGTGTITTVGTVTFAYKRSDGWMDWYSSITITTNGTGATNLGFTLPIALGGTIIEIGYGRESAVSGKMLSVNGGGTSAIVQNYDNTYPAASGAILRLTGRYQMTTRYS